MNSSWKKAGLFLLMAAIGLSGCHKTEEGKDTVANIYQNLEEDIEEIKNISYDNLSLEKLKNVSFPDISSYAQIEITQEPQTFDDAYALMLRCAEQWYPDLTEEDLLEILQVELYSEGYAALLEQGEDAHDLLYKDYLQKPEKYQDYFASFYFRYEHGKYSGGIWKDGVTSWQRYQMRDLDTGIEWVSSMYAPSSYHEPTVVYKWYEFSDDTYMLSDGKISIKEAAVLIEDYFENRLPYAHSESISCHVAEIAVYEIQEGMYGLEANLCREYNDIPFACLPLLVSFESYTGYDEESAEAGIVKTDDVDYCFAWMAEGNVKETKTVKEILTLESALGIINETFSEGMMLDIAAISFEYVRIGIDEQTGATSFIPVWRFEAYNRIDGRMFVIYVDPVSGECSYKVSRN